jgi:hypothetical protein
MAVTGTTGLTRSGKIARPTPIFKYGGALSEIRPIAVRRASTPLEWNNDAMKFTNDAEEKPLPTPDYREGWSL